MNKSKVDPACVRHLLVVLSLALVSTACSAQTAAPSTSAESTPLPAVNSPVPPSPTPIPPTPTPLPPTAMPTPVPLPASMEELITVDDLPAGFEWSLSSVHRSLINPLEVKAYSSVRYYGEEGWLFAELTVANKPYDGISENLLSDSRGTPVDAPLVGQYSQFYLVREDPLQSSFTFVKRNVLVTLYGPISVDAAVKLAQTMEARITEGISNPPPITFPDQLDTIFAAKYFKPIALGKCSEDSKDFAPTAVFSTTQIFTTEPCIQMEWASQEAENIKKLEYAIYDLQSQAYIIRYSSAHGFAGTLLLPRMPGKYEMRVAADDVLVAVLPFEVQ